MEEINYNNRYRGYEQLTENLIAFISTAIPLKIFIFHLISKYSFPF